MNIFERLAQHFGCTFSVHFAKSSGGDLKYINLSAIVTGVIVIAAIVVIVAGVIYIKKNVKNK